MHQVLFYSMGGNTKNLADVIAEELGVKAADIKAASIDPATEIIFLCSGCYGSKPDEDALIFIERNDSSGRKVAVFGTSDENARMEVDVMAAALKHKGATVLGSYPAKAKLSCFSTRATRTRKIWLVRESSPKRRRSLVSHTKPC